jgi:hypothetical protein
MSKKDYIVKQLGRTEKKNLENYCITRLYHKLDRLDVQFVTQQLFKRNDGRIALADLYLPQINMLIEVDEWHPDEEKDKSRTDEIIKNRINGFEEVVYHNLEEFRIKAGKDPETNKEIELEHVNQQIDYLVDKIKRKISSLQDKFVSWNGAYPNPQHFIDKGYIDTADKPSFRTVQEVSELFNKGYKGMQKCWFEVEKGNNIRVWCPKLQLRQDDCPNVPYLNEISSDGATIWESARDKWKNPQFIDIVINGKHKELTIRYVFAYYKDSIGEGRYRFRGVFQINKQRTIAENKRVWEKISDRVDLTKYCLISN